MVPFISLAFHSTCIHKLCQQKHEAMSHNVLRCTAIKALRGAVRHNVKGCYEVISECFLGFYVILNLTLPIRNKDQKGPLYNRHQHHHRSGATAVPNRSLALSWHISFGPGNWTTDGAKATKTSQRAICLLHCPNFNPSLTFFRSAAHLNTTAEL